MRDLQEYGSGYYILWMFYTDLYVIEKIETYIYDFDTALVAVGGSMTLFLGWSCSSIVLCLIELMHEKATAQFHMKVQTNIIKVAEFPRH